MDHDALLAAESARVGVLAPGLRLPDRRRAAPVVSGEPLETAGAACVVEIVTWPQDAFERIVLGDRTGYLHLVALPDPSAHGAVCSGRASSTK
jgi:hypothetical protein